MFVCILSCFKTDSMELKFVDACEKGNLHRAKKIYEIHNVNINFNDDEAFRSCCRNGHVKIAKWLANIPNNKININSVIDYFFILNCQMGYTDLAKLLFNLPNHKTITNFDGAFHNACIHGHTNTAKWLLYASNNNINLQDTTFSTTCFSGHYNTVKWLLNLQNINLDKNFMNNRLLRGVCFFSNIRIAKLLIETRKMSNELINKSFLDIDIKIINENSLDSCVFDNYYFPINDHMMNLYRKYKVCEISKFDQIKDKYLILDLWKIVYSYLFVAD